jgi:hypothetical protein
MKIAIWLGAILIGLALWLHTPDWVWHYIFHLRAPILAAAFLVALPFLAVTWLRAMLRNLFVLRGHWQIAFVIAGAIAAGLSIVLVTNVILSNAPARFGLPAWLTIPEWGQYLLTVVLALPTCYQTVDLSRERLDISADASKEQEKPDGRQRWLGVAIGVGFSAVLIALVSLTRHWLEDNNQLQQPLLRLISILTKQESQGYLDAQGGLATGHTTALAFLLVGLIVYLIVARLFRPQPISGRREAPALLYVMMILSGVVLLAGGSTFFFDFYRILSLIGAIAISVAVYQLFNVDHFYKLLPSHQASSQSLPAQFSDFAAVLEKRLQHQSGEKTLVVVCASGGGIQAAGWTVEVLLGLQRLLGQSFTQATGLISSVSGGSVGAMYFLDRFNLDQQKRCPDDADLEPIFHSATSDSLDAVGWGLTYLDLWRLLGFPFLIHKLFDRGTAVETDWKGELRNPKASLVDWREQVMAGKIPIPIFNATLVEDGRRYLISPMTFARSSELVSQDKFVDFNTLYGNYDMNIATAARLSATFPYISPICRPYVIGSDGVNLKGKNYHVADGGYFDNSGVFTAIEWLNRLLESGHVPQIKRIVLLQINAFPKSLPGRQQTSDGGWATALLGPILTLLRVRDSTQTARNETEIDFLCQRWSKQGITIKHCPIFFPSYEQMQQQVEKKFAPQMQRPYFFNQDGKYDPPLSWKLTNAEKKAIKRAWSAIASQPDGEVQKLQTLWQDWDMNALGTEQINL